MIRRGLGALGAVFLSAAACAHRPPTAAAPAPTPIPASEASAAPTPPAAPPSAISLARIEPSLVSAEDRRAFDALLLSSAASSADPTVRARAALALGRIGDARAVTLLRPLLADSSADVRAQAAFAAGILGEADLSTALVSVLDDTTDGVVARSAWAIGLLGQAAAESALAGAVPKAASASRRAALLMGLGRFGDETAAAAAAPFAADPDVSVRAAALYVLARRPLSGSAGILTSGLSDSNAQTAALCARALGILGAPDAIGPLAAVIETGPQPARINALLALAALLEKNPGSVLPPERGARIVALCGDVNPNVAVPALALARWLVQAEDREAFRRLWAAARTGRGRRQQVALESLMGALGSKSLELVDSAMASEDPFLRGAAASGLSFLPDPDAAPRREKLAADPSAVVRLKVLEGLKTSADVAQSRALVDRLLGDSDAGIRAAAIDALGQLAEKGLLSRLREIVIASYPESAPDVPLSAMGVAEKTPDDPDARAVVEAAYRHPATLVSRLARRSLVRTFHADPGQFPWREYVTGKTDADYAALIADARRPWKLEVETARGAFTIRLDGGFAPLTVMNALALAGKEYFDGAPIHRVVPNFVVQDGDPTGTGDGGPGYEIRDELSSAPYDALTVGMALAGPDTGGSQWFVTQAAEPHLDGLYTVIGRVVSGRDVVLRIEQDDRILRVSASVAGGGAL
jgi:cyclophilin family peptidyl-prolyl cis-trans isomerase/HEAT repeat protein